MNPAQLTLRTVDGVDVPVRIAGLGSRSYAFIIDWHLRLLAALAWFLIAFLVVRTPERPAGVWFIALPSVLIYFGYHPILEIALRGLTPGKRMAGVRLVSRDGGVPGVGALLVRNLFRLLDSLPLFYGVGLVVAMFNSQHLRVGDIAAGTLLVYDTAAPASAADLLPATAELAPQTALLADELLRRWPELQPARRAALADSLLQRAGRPVPATDADLRAALQRLLGQ